MERLERFPLCITMGELVFDLLPLVSSQHIYTFSAMPDRDTSPPGGPPTLLSIFWKKCSQNRNNLHFVAIRNPMSRMRCID